MISIVYACNDAYVRQTLVSIASVWKYNPDAKIYLISDRISDENRKQIQQMAGQYRKKIIVTELKSVLPDLHLDSRDRHPHTIYAKLFLDQFVSDERVLYLDSDVIVQGTLEDLYRRDMSQELAAGVLMHYSSKIKERMRLRAGSPYICDGFVLLNLDMWRKENMRKRCIQYILEYNGKPPMLSESTLNYVCQGKIGILPPRYNLMPTMLMYRLDEIIKLYRSDCYYEDEAAMKTAVQNPIIIHFMNELYNRPWCEPCEHPFKDRYHEIEREVFGENQIIERPLSRHTRMTVWLRKHLPFWLFAQLYHLKNHL